MEEDDADPAALTVLEARALEARQRAKTSNKDIKRDIKEAEAAHDKLLRQLRESTLEAVRLQQGCFAELREAADRVAENAALEEEEGAVGSARGPEALCSASGNASDARRHADCFYSADRLPLMAKKRALEEELRQVDAQARQYREGAKELQARAAAEEEEVRALEGLLDAGRGLGFPYIDVDCEKGRVLVGGDGDELSLRVEEHLRTIEARFGEGGRLIHAAPHHSLGLEKLAARAVAEDDLGRLVAGVWHALVGVDDAPAGGADGAPLAAPRSRRQRQLIAQSGGA